MEELPRPASSLLKKSFTRQRGKNSLAREKLFEAYEAAPATASPPSLAPPRNGLSRAASLETGIAAPCNCVEKNNHKCGFEGRAHQGSELRPRLKFEARRAGLGRHERVFRTAVETLLERLLKCRGAPSENGI